MHYDVIEARHVAGFTVHLRFRDGTVGDVDLTDAMWGPVFVPLKSPEAFRTFSVDPQFHTLVWPNGADIAPEYLYEQARVAT